MTRDVHLNVLLPKNRNHPGRLRIEVSGVPKAEFPILGRGSTKVGKKPTGNPSLNPYLYAGIPQRALTLARDSKTLAIGSRAAMDRGGQCSCARSVATL